MTDLKDPLERGREAGARRAWTDAFECLSQGDSERGLGAEDLELLATAAYMTGRDDAYVNLQTADEGEERIRASYGDNFERLVEIKRRYDPHNQFRSNRNVRP